MFSAAVYAQGKEASSASESVLRTGQALFAGTTVNSAKDPFVSDPK
jgi:hypothetical protein